MLTMSLRMEQNSHILEDSNNEGSFVGAQMGPFVDLICHHHKECSPEGNIHEQQFDLEGVLNSPERDNYQEWHWNNARVGTDFNKIVTSHSLWVNVVFAERANKHAPEFGLGSAPGVACPVNYTGEEVCQKKRNNKSNGGGGDVLQPATRHDLDVVGGSAPKDREEDHDGDLYSALSGRIARS